MYKHTLKFADQIFEEGMTLPANTNDTAAAALRVDGTNGRLAICVLANDDNVAVANTKKLTISYTEAATETGSYAAPGAKPSLVITMDGNYAPDAGDVIGRLLLPADVGPWVKPVIATDDTGAAGKIDIILEYIGN